MKAAILIASFLLVLSGFLFWRFYSKTLVPQTSQTQAVENMFEEQANALVEEEVGQVVENITQEDIEALLE
ncbi:MAG: hypothetical protein N3E38_01790 [Candidatus Aenigmarchaeota archaeon]|nr:hypothetical protein [Candidatus Aenigmarchaeota archaeon]MCX8179450.1 hypothetical protein [Candidatus Aenigmarchaeota archaeon]